jgi:hypothetical protein
MPFFMRTLASAMQVAVNKRRRKPARVTRVVSKNRV